MDIVQTNYILRYVIPVVTFHDVWPPDPELACAVHRERLTGVRIDDLSLGVGRQQPSRAVAAALLCRVRGRADGRALREPVPLQDLHLRVLVPEPFDELLAERRAAGEDLAQLAERQRASGLGCATMATRMGGMSGR